MSASANLKAWLDVVAACEGTATPDGYRALFGYDPVRRPTRLFDNAFAQHPNIKFSFTQTDGTISFTTAAGRYQIIFPTYSRLSSRLGTSDYTPETQDLMAIELTSERGALLDVETGDIATAVDKCSAEWASLPASHYAQPKRSMEFALAAYQSAGGMLS